MKHTLQSPYIFQMSSRSDKHYDGLANNTGTIATSTVLTLQTSISVFVTDPYLFGCKLSDYDSLSTEKGQSPSAMTSTVPRFSKGTYLITVVQPLLNATYFIS